MTKREKLIAAKAAYDKRMAARTSRRVLAYCIRTVFFTGCALLIGIAALCVNPVWSQKTALFLRRLRFFAMPLTELLGWMSNGR